MISEGCHLQASKRTSAALLLPSASNIHAEGGNGPFLVNCDTAPSITQPCGFLACIHLVSRQQVRMQIVCIIPQFTNSISSHSVWGAIQQHPAATGSQSIELVLKKDHSRSSLLQRPIMSEGKKHMLLLSVFRSCPLCPGIRCICVFALKNKVVRSCMPSHPHAAAVTPSSVLSCVFCLLCLQNLEEMKVKMDPWGKPQCSNLQVLLRNAQKSQAWMGGLERGPKTVI